MKIVGAAIYDCMGQIPLRGAEHRRPASFLPDLYEIQCTRHDIRKTRPSVVALRLGDAAGATTRLSAK